jgi:hypothetical protein
MSEKINIVSAFASKLLSHDLTLDEVTPIVNDPAIQAALRGGVDAAALAFAIARGLKPEAEQKAPMPADPPARPGAPLVQVSITGAPPADAATAEFFDGIRKAAEGRGPKKETSGNAEAMRRMGLRSR